MSNTQKYLCTIVLLTASLSLTISAQSPQGFRGSERNGFYPQTGLLESWPESGPELIWEAHDAGSGYSSPVIYGGHLFITGMNEGKDRETFSAYTLNGEKLYEVEYGKPWDGTYPETRTTPTIKGDRAYVISGSGEVVCINTNNGEIIWKVDGGVKFERETGRWGTAESPLVFDNKVMFTPGGNKTTMVALDAETGETVWKTIPLEDNSSYVSPLLINHSGLNRIIGVTDSYVFSVDPGNGNIEWTFSDWGREGRENIAPNTPLYHNGRLFFSFGYELGSFMLELNEDASGATLAWRNDDMSTHHGHFVLVNGIIYGSNWISNNQGNWVALDWESGETLFAEDWPGGRSKGSIITTGKKLYTLCERRGAIGLVRPAPEGFDLISEFRITQGEGPYWSHPVIEDGVLYLRRGPAIKAFNISQ